MTFLVPSTENKNLPPPTAVGGGFYVIIYKMAKYLIFVFGVLFLGILFLHPSSPPPEPKEITITIPEGFTAEQIGELFEKNNLFTKGDFLAVAGANEGYLFPDTYNFFKNTAPEKAVEKMKNNFNAKTAEFLPEIANQKKSLDDVVIMASIIEKEVHKPEDRKIVSGILWKRLKRGIGLQVDAAPDTYKYKGLPNGPISNPGKESIEAAVYPAKSPYLFYLSSKDGVTHYARNFDEHKNNKFKYLQ